MTLTQRQVDALRGLGFEVEGGSTYIRGKPWCVWEPGDISPVYHETELGAWKAIWDYLLQHAESYMPRLMAALMEGPEFNIIYVKGYAADCCWLEHVTRAMSVEADSWPKAWWALWAMVVAGVEEEAA